MEQTDDAAALLRALDLAPAAVVGHSGGASIACCLVVRHLEVVRHAVLYEPPLLSVVPDGEELVAGYRAAAEQAMAEGGPRRAMEVFMRTIAGDEIVDELFESIDPTERDRILDNGAVFFPIELPAFAALVPDRDGMRADGVSLTVVAGEQNRDTWLGPGRPGWPRGPGPTTSSCPAGTWDSSATRRRSWSWCAASSAETLRPESHPPARRSCYRQATPPVGAPCPAHRHHPTGPHHQPANAIP